METVEILDVVDRRGEPRAGGERDRTPALLTTFKASQRVSFLSTWNVLGW